MHSEFNWPLRNNCLWHICTDTVLNLGHELILKLRSLHFDDFSKFYWARWFVTHIIFCSQVKLSLKKMIIRQSSFTFIYGQCLDRADWKVGYSAAGLAHSKHEDGSAKFPSWINNRFLMERGMVSTPKMGYQVFLCIFQNYTMAEITSIKGSFLALGARSQSWK